MTAVLDPPRGRTGATGSGGLFQGVVRFVLLAAWLVVLLGAVFLTERPSDWDQLEQAVARGDVDRVVVRGDGSVEGRGWSYADVAWRDGPFAHHTEVLVANPREAGLRQVDRGTFGEATLVTTRDVSSRLASLDPGLSVDSRPMEGGATFEAFPGWQLKGWVFGVALGAFVATLFLLALGPETRRATQWAWFWLLITPFAPVVAIGLLVLGYPTRFLPPGKPGRQGLTGGWAFVVSLVLGAYRSA